MNRNLVSSIRRVLAVVCLLVATGAAFADDDDHDVARRALAEGKIRPLAEIMAQVQSQVPGEIIKVELKSKKAAYIYEFKMLTPAGEIKELKVDATTATILKIENDD
jgi:uncharacterized membrane protein YkoI